jgi:hypothetical protein
MTMMNTEVHLEEGNLDDGDRATSAWTASPRRIAGHLKAAAGFAKLGLCNRAEAARHVIRHKPARR